MAVFQRLNPRDPSSYKTVVPFSFPQMFANMLLSPSFDHVQTSPFPYLYADGRGRVCEICTSEQSEVASLKFTQLVFPLRSVIVFARIGRNRYRLRSGYHVTLLRRASAVL